MNAKELARSLTIFSLCVVLVVAPIEKHTTSLWLAAQAMALISALFMVLASEWAERGRRTLLRHPLTLALMQSALILIAVRVTAQLQHGAEQALTTVGFFIKDYAGILFLSLAAWNGRRHLRHSDLADSWLMKATDALIWVWLGLVLLSAAASQDPAISFEHLRKETGIYLILYLICLEAASRMADFQRLIRMLAVVGLCATVLAGVLYHYYDTRIEETSGYSVCEWMRSQELIEHRDPQPGQEFSVVWPAGHPSRLASVAIVFTFSLLAGAATMQRGELKTLWGLAAIVPAYVIFLSRTPEAVLALAVGLVCLWCMLLWLFACGLKKRWLIPVLLLPLVAGAGVYFLTPPETLARARQLLQTELHSNPDPVVQEKLQGWRIAVHLTGQNPGLGIGHGWENFENADQQLLEEPQALKNISHAQNNLLEGVVENGLPAGGVWLILHLLFAAVLIRAFLNRNLNLRLRYMLAVICSMHLSLSCLGLVDFTLRDRAGAIIWIVTALALALARQTGRSEEEPNQTGSEPV